MINIMKYCWSGKMLLFSFCPQLKWWIYMDYIQIPLLYALALSKVRKVYILSRQKRLLWTTFFSGICSSVLGSRASQPQSICWCFFLCLINYVFIFFPLAKSTHIINKESSQKLFFFICSALQECLVMHQTKWSFIIRLINEAGQVWTHFLHPNLFGF